MIELSDKEKLRYSRHLMLKEVGEAGQLTLKSAKVLVVGAGGLGSPALLYLAAAGVGSITLIDDDKVELSNLQRQVLYKVNHLGQQKAKAAGKVLASLNNQITLNVVCDKLTQDNASELVSGMDVVLDCSDNFATRYTVNQFCVKHLVPLVSAAAIAADGQLMCFDFRQPQSPCYHCVYPKVDEQSQLNCDNAGVISPLLGVMGSMQSLLVLNLLLGHHHGSQFIVFDGMTLQQRQFQMSRDENCAVCGVNSKR